MIFKDQMPDYASTLKEAFGFHSFRPGQEEAIQSLLAGQNTLVVMPTGAGKSLVFQIAALQFKALSLVISPLIALMKDQVDSLTRRNIPATYINSALPPTEQTTRLQELTQGKYKIVYVAPERMRNVSFLKALERQEVALLVVDEAHCISEWGHDFRPDYLHIAQARSRLNDPLTAALTATATPKVQDDIVQSLGLGNAKRIITGFNRPNLAFEVRYLSDTPGKLREVKDLLSLEPDGATIIYTGTRRDAEELTDFIREVIRQPSDYYHAGLSADDRTRIQNDFISGNLKIIAATNAFGMGIDRADVRQVIHYSIPASLEAYYQEAGRAGRDGLPSKAILFYDPKDRSLQEFFIETSILKLEDLRLLHNVLRNDLDTRLTLDDFSLATSLHGVQIKVGLAELERAGALDHLGDEGYYMLLRKGEWKLAEIEKSIARNAVHIEHRRVQLAAMIRYAESDNCRRQTILAHFGDKSPLEAQDCCDNCRASQAAPQETHPAQPKDILELTQGERAALIILDTVRRLKFSVGKEKIAQILKGSKAKDILRFHYDRHPYYGKLSPVQQSEIEGLTRQLIDLKYLKVVGGKYPVLRLTPAGEQAIQQKVSITLELPKSMAPANLTRAKVRLIAGGTVEYTAQFFAGGKTPEEIAQERGLALNTIYHHLAQLIEHGKVSIEQVVPGEIRKKVEAAIQKTGSMQYRLLINALADEAIKFEYIYCVVANHRAKISKNVGPLDIADTILECVRSLPGRFPRSGVAKLLNGSRSERVKDYQTHPLYNRLGKLNRSQIMIVVDRLLEEGKLSKNENGYLVIASSSPLPSKLIPPSSSSSNLIPDSSIRHFLSKSHPRPLTGPWSMGWALGFHSRFSGSDWDRSSVGDLLYRLKYESDETAVPSLVSHAVELIHEHPKMREVDAILPVPSTAERQVNPVRIFCDALATRLKLPVLPILNKTHQTQPQKELHTLAQKRANVAGAFMLTSEVKGMHFLVVDDLYDSGATLEEITRLLLKRGALQVNVLTITRTIHSDM